MTFVSRYVSHQPDKKGFVAYSNEENSVWCTLFERQQLLLPQRAANEYIQGLSELGLNAKTIPQLPEVSHYLRSKTGWSVVPVAALISAREFFELLANKCFPAATFIRTREELDYVKEPDIFHELFGHCPMLTIPVYANFIHEYACKVLEYPESEWALFQRLFWFTVEFGLIQTPEGIRAYGGGILSSISETAYSVESDIPLRCVYNPIAALRTPYRIDQLQPIYFVINSYEDLYATTQKMPNYIARARTLGEFTPFFIMDDQLQNIHIHAC